MPWSELYNRSSQSYTRQGHISLRGSPVVPHLWAEKFTAQQLQTRRQILTCTDFGSSNCFRCYRHFSFKSGFIASATEKSASSCQPLKTGCMNSTHRNVAVGIQFIPLAFEYFGGYSETLRKTLKRIAALADNRSLQRVGYL